MTKLEAKELIRAENLIDEGKLDEALTFLNNYAQKEGLNHHDKASCHLLQCQILFWQGKLKELIKRAEKMDKESRGRESNLFIVDNLLIMAYTLVKLDRFDKAVDLIKQGEELIESFSQELTKAYKQRKAYLAFIKGYYYNRRRDQNDADLALKHLGHSLVMREELGIQHEIAESLDQIAWNLLIYKGEMDRALKYSERSASFARESRKKYYIASNSHVMALIYASLGELDRCIETNEQGLELFKELNNKYGMTDILNNLSFDYSMNGDLDRALDCMELAMELNRELGSLRSLANNHDFLIQILIERGDLERARQTLNDLERLNTQLKDKQMDIMYLLDKALLLKVSLKARDRGKAKEILIQLLENENLTHDETYTALINLCEMLLTELRMTNDLGVLDELNQFLGQLLELSEKSHSYWIMGETYLLLAKLALLSLDLNEARRLLTQGQRIAERYGIKLLAMKISNEHDQLLKQLNMWENLKESTSSLKERMEFARLNEQMDNIVRRRSVEVPVLLNEEPVFLLIVSEGGTPIFSQSFKRDHTFEDYLFGGFFSAINSFINEKFSEGLDRATFGEHTLLMNSISPFLMCYVYKGQSYVAQQRIRYFIEQLQDDKDTWQTFRDYDRLSKEIQIKDIPSLELLVTKIFIDKSIPVIA
ncbi:MAG: tetratricopeptide repeat protein [Candidatus Hodarchaeota archaeon]